MNQISIKGIKIDKITIDQAVDQVLEWIKKGGKHYVVTPNVEMIMAAQTDTDFKRILNDADLAIPDSARLGWAKAVIEAKNPLKKLGLWSLFLFPQLFKFPVTTGTDVMDQIINESAEKGATVGFIGGKTGVAERLRERLLKEYPKLRVTIARSDLVVDNQGMLVVPSELDVPSTDVLFVGLGHGKQERWIKNNLQTQKVKVMIGVGGALDYLSGRVTRAPRWMRILGLEWLYRVINEPWRIKRFGSIVNFLSTILFAKANKLH